MAAGQMPLELILARNLIAAISLAAFLVDADGTLVFFNQRAGELVGRPFEETGHLAASDAATEFGPYDAEGNPIAQRELDLVRAIREGLPASGRFHLRRGDDLVEVEGSGPHQPHQPPLRSE